MKLDRFEYGRQFEVLAKELFLKMDYAIRVPNSIRDQGYDLIATKNTFSYYVELKFYRSQNTPFNIIKETANQLAYAMRTAENASGLLIVNYRVNDAQKHQILLDYGIHIWDREYLYALFSKYDITLADQYEKLLIRSQQGTKSIPVLKKEQQFKDDNNKPPTLNTPSKYDAIPIKKGEALSQELNHIGCGRDEWRAYELKCQEILKYLFDDDLSLWEEQARSDDGLSRYDLICRISARDDYWKSLMDAFNTRFILFEFKNYCNPITQGQIYTTERYLYNTALRSVGFIISRKGATDNAIKAAKGALRAHGKLILLLSDKDLCNMLTLRDQNDSPNDYLSNLLDRWLIALSR
jgi:Holliday junction resolvase